MADQVSSGTMADRTPDGTPVAPADAHITTESVVGEPFHGRPVSWVAVSIIMVAFVVGGLGLILGPAWWLFWTGVGLAVVGGLIALATNIFEDWY